LRALSLGLVMVYALNGCAASMTGQNTVQLSVGPEAKMRTFVSNRNSIRIEISIRLNPGSTALFRSKAVQLFGGNPVPVYPIDRSGTYTVLLSNTESRMIQFQLRSDDGTIDVSESILLP
jgi:hypothetical protein